MTTGDVLPVRSDCCGLDEMFLSCVPGEAVRARLDLGAGWTQRWSAAWRVSGRDVVTAVRDLGLVPVAGCEPVRRFSWGRRQRHRPGLQFMVSTGRVHGFESLEEQSLLLALDFTGALEDVLPQPFTLRFGDLGAVLGPATVPGELPAALTPRRAACRTRTATWRCGGHPAVGAGRAMDRRHQRLL